LIGWTHANLEFPSPKGLRENTWFKKLKGGINRNDLKIENAKKRFHPVRFDEVVVLLGSPCE